MVLGACEVLTKWLCTHYLPVITEALIHYSGAVHLRSLLPQIFHVDRSARSLPSCESSLNLLDLLLLVISEKPVTVDISPSLKFITTDWSGELLRTCWALYLSWRWTDKIGQVQSLRTVVLISNWNDFLTIRRVRHRCWISDLTLVSARRQSSANIFFLTPFSQHVILPHSLTVVSGFASLISLPK